jgi:hypothetical protein
MKGDALAVLDKSFWKRHLACRKRENGLMMMMMMIMIMTMMMIYREYVF